MVSDYGCSLVPVQMAVSGTKTSDCNSAGKVEMSCAFRLGPFLLPRGKENARGLFN